jgi:hypothetical protein
VTGKQGRRHKQVLDNLREMTGYWKLKEKAPNFTLWRIRFRVHYRSVVRQSLE